mgnify:CR=1 FL=1
MTMPTTQKGYVARKMEDVEPLQCLCGSSTRIITREDGPELGFHIVHIQDSTRHYHKNTTEIYYILEGSGYLEVGDDTLELTPGMTVKIEPGTVHRGYGDFKTIVVCSPALDESDEYLEDGSARH